MTDPLGLLVVGGGPAGLSAARAYREHDGRGWVRIVSADRHPPYDRPPLTKGYLRGESGPEDLPLEDASFYRDHDIEVVLETRLDRLDPESFGACVVATGARPQPLPLPGGHEGLLLRSRTEGEVLREAAGTAARALVVGSGFIGCEAAASLAERGLEVTMVTVEEAPHQARLGDEVAARITGWLEQAGVAVHTGREPTQRDLTGADLVLLGGGAAPQGEVAARSGLALHEGRVVVDERMATSDPRVWAAGDVTWARNASAGRHLAVEHWGEAERMGEIAGTNAAGGDDTWTNAPGFWTEIGPHTLKYAAWGDGFDDVRFHDHGDGAFTAWYGRGGVVVGVLTHDADDDYERGQELVEKGGAW